ncbi:MAG: cytidylate kinase-like family protein [Thermoanaerobaculales bacterium]|nr:cytidylate kinase-like family protein [Thermoanaerobaculales bacterium]
MTTETTNEIVQRMDDHRLDWERIKRNIGAALHHQLPDDPPDHHMGPFVAVSRLSGAGGGAFARRLGEALDWPVLDGEIVDLIADAFQLDGAMLHLLDEARANWVREVLGDLMPHQIVNLDTYVHHLGKVIRLAGMHGNVVLVGRGSQFFLPRDRGLTVRLVASEDERVRRVSNRDGVNAAEARKRIEEVDHRRAHFLEHYFGHTVDDPSLYDLVLNRSTLSDDELLKIVLAVVHQRGYDK